MTETRELSTLEVLLIEVVQDRDDRVGELVAQVEKLLERNRKGQLHSMTLSNKNQELHDEITRLNNVVHDWSERYNVDLKERDALRLKTTRLEIELEDHNNDLKEYGRITNRRDVKAAYIEFFGDPDER
jgi:hypothetical protein